MSDQPAPASTPIPAGVLTVDDEPNVWGRFYVLDLNGWCVGEVTDKQRARLLAGPARPTGVPDELVSAALDRLCDLGGDDHGHTDCWIIGGLLTALGVPVPPYQPAPDPEQLLNEKITADWATPPTGTWAGYCSADSAPPVAAGERTGPLGLSEAETRKVARQDNSWADLAVGVGTLARKAWDAAQAACRAAVAEWDAQPEPAETLADIAAECDGWTDNKWFDDPRSFIYYIHQIAERVKAAQKREREKIEAATRAAPATIPVNRDDLRTVIDASSRAVDRNAAYVRLRAALAAAGLPQEPTEPEPTEPEAQR